VARLPLEVPVPMPGGCRQVLSPAEKLSAPAAGLSAGAVGGFRAAGGSCAGGGRQRCRRACTESRPNRSAGGSRGSSLPVPKPASPASGTNRRGSAGHLFFTGYDTTRSDEQPTRGTRGRVRPCPSKALTACRAVLAPTPPAVALQIPAPLLRADYALPVAPTRTMP